MTAQCIMAVEIGGEFYTVLVRTKRYSRSLKLARKRLYLAEKLLTDESAFLAQRPDIAARLLAGEVVEL